jgi:hypothetical protein
MRLHGALALFDERRIEQLARSARSSCHAEVVDVRHERHVERRRLKLDVEVAEGHWMRRGRTGGEK